MSFRFRDEVFTNNRRFAHEICKKKYRKQTKRFVKIDMLKCSHEISSF